MVTLHFRKKKANILLIKKVFQGRLYDVPSAKEQIKKLYFRDRLLGRINKTILTIAEGGKIKLPFFPDQSRGRKKKMKFTRPPYREGK